MNNLARAVTKWTKACDTRLARWISRVNYTKEPLTTWSFCNLLSALTLRRSRRCIILFSRVNDSIAGLDWNYRKCCWVQYGTEGRDSLQTWISKNCDEFREMQIVRHAKYVGTMIGPDGHLHRWTALGKHNTLFQDSDLAGDFEDSKSTSRGVPCIFGNHTFVPISCMCKKHVSHSSTEAEIISLDAGLGMYGTPALILWDLLVETLQSPPSM